MKYILYIFSPTGQCIGPAFPGFCYGTKKGVHPVPIQYKHLPIFDAYMQGGGYFKPYLTHDSSKTKILGSYLSLPHHPAAVVKCSVGKGVVVLSGIHLEYIATSLEKDNPYLLNSIPQFLQSDSMRDVVFKDLLLELGIYIEPLHSRL